jgi:hypothetical protein
MEITHPANTEPQSSPSTVKTAAPIKVWKPWTIGGMTIIIGIFQPEFGVAVGFALAVINWYRLHQRRTALINLIVGILLVIATTAMHYYVERQTWIPNYTEFGIQLLASFAWLFLVAAYLHLKTAHDLARAQKRFDVQPASQWMAAGIVIVVLAISALIRPVIHSGVAQAMTSPLQTTSRFVGTGTPAIQGSVHPWANAPIANRRVVLCRLEEHRSDPLAPYICTVTQFTANTDQRGRFSIDNVPPGRYLVFYDSGFADFQTGVEKWANHRIPLGPYAGWAGVFKSYEYRPSAYPPPGTKLNDFYYLYAEATLMLGGSPFVLAHDIRAASSYTDRIETWRPLPPGVFIPTVIEVRDGQTSEVEFDVLKWQE